GESSRSPARCAGGGAGGMIRPCRLRPPRGRAGMSEQERTYLQTPEQWTQFLSAFVHELRTPLASFRMLADLLAEAPRDHLGEQERRYSENLREVVQDIQSLVGEAGELSRLLS